MKNIKIVFFMILSPLVLLCQNLEVDGDAKIVGRVTNVTDPINAQDVATKNYVDQMSEMMLDAGLNGIVKDIDGNVYRTIKIGSQVWMADNLKTTHYNDGTAIPEVTDNTAWGNLTTPAYSWYDNDSTFYAALYGILYNYYTVADTNNLNVCPIGWHVPTYDEFVALEVYLTGSGYGYGGSGSDIAKSLAATFRWANFGTAGTVGNDLGSNNSSGFTGLPSGDRDTSGGFFDIGTFGIWWSSTEYEHDSSKAWSRVFTYNGDVIYWFFEDKKWGKAVRCLKD